MEDYKKKYEEALERAKKWEGNKAAVEYIFPELAENEDEKQGKHKPTHKEPIVVRDFNSVFSREQVEEIDKRIEESQRLYNAKLRDAMRKVEDFPMTD